MSDVQVLVAHAHAFATLGMTGVIWFVQLAHYPGFARVGAEDFAAYHHAHVRRTTWVVAPLMLSEVATTAYFAYRPPAGGGGAVLVGFVLLFVVWLSTGLLQIPCHHRLEQGKDDAVIRRLVATNWVRTFAWTGRGVVALWLLALAIRR